MNKNDFERLIMSDSKENDLIRIAGILTPRNKARVILDCAESFVIDIVDSTDKSFAKDYFCIGWQAATSQQAERIAQLELALKQKDDALNLVSKYVKHNDIGGAWTNYPDKPEVTINDIITNALAIQPSQESLDAYVMSRLEVSAYAYINNDEECEQIEWTLGTDEKYPEFMPLYRLKDK